MLRYAWAWLCWAVVRVGYWIRPYDDLADARRWRWRPRTPCPYLWLREGDDDA